MRRAGVITQVVASDVICGRYRLDERIATGGMGEVWAAYDLELERRVALKLLDPHADRARFEREARAAAALSHPGICLLYDYGESDGRPFIVLEHLAGGTLEDRLAAGEPLPDEEAARIARELAAALAHAHEHGLVHRDVKPGNVLFDDEGRAKITDFGIARMVELSTLTEAGTLLGTAAYISPEQARGEPATGASDVYSFGVVLYRMLTGRLPFVSERPLELAELHEQAQPPPIHSLRPDAPPDLERLASAAMAKRPEERPADGSALLALLAGEPGTEAATGVTEAATGVLGPPVVHTEPLTPGPAPPRRRGPAIVAGAAVITLLAAGFGVALLTAFDDSAPPATGSERRSVTTGNATSTTRPATTTEARRTTTRAGTTTPPATAPAIPPTQTAAPTTPTRATTTSSTTTTPTETETTPETTTELTETTPTTTETTPTTTETTPTTTEPTPPATTTATTTP